MLCGLWVNPIKLNPQRGFNLAAPKEQFSCEVKRNNLALHAVQNLAQKNRVQIKM